MGAGTERQADAGELRRHSAPTMSRRHARAASSASNRDVDQAGVVRALAALRQRSSQAGEARLGALADVTEDFVRQWDQSRQAAGASRAAYEAALDTEARHRRDVSAVLVAVGAILSEPTASGGPLGRTLTADLGRESDAASRPVGPSDARSLVARLLGPFELYVEGRSVDTAAGTKTHRLLRYLLTSRRKVARDVLIDAFWPEADLETGRRNLHQAVYINRKILRGPSNRVPVIMFEGDTYSVNPEAGLWSDLDVFDSEIAAGHAAEAEERGADAEQHFRVACELYRGELLEDTPYEEWALAPRDHYRVAFADAANRLARLELERGDLAAALSTAQRALEREPCDETMHRLAMRVHARMGQRSLMVRQYRACVHALAATYDTEPSEETTSLFSELRDVG